MNNTPCNCNEASPLHSFCFGKADVLEGFGAETPPVYVPRKEVILPGFGAETPPMR